MSTITTTFNRDSWARWYAKRHLETDPGIELIQYLPNKAGEREIRLVEVNKLIGERTNDVLEPIDFGIDRGMETEHRLFVLDVTPSQWKQIKDGTLSLPDGWSLDDATPFINE